MRLRLRMSYPFYANKLLHLNCNFRNQLVCTFQKIDTQNFHVCRWPKCNWLWLCFWLNKHQNLQVALKQVVYRYIVEVHYNLVQNKFSKLNQCFVTFYSFEHLWSEPTYFSRDTIFTVNNAFSRVVVILPTAFVGYWIVEPFAIWR